MEKFICICLVCFTSVCASFVNEQTYNGLVKRQIKEKIIRANEVIKSKKLDRYRTFSIMVDGHLIYCHYERQRKNSLPLIICY